jgi:hypothetical protein
MAIMSKDMFSSSEKIRKQCELVWDNIELMSEIILHKNLVPSDEGDILDYTKRTGKIIPPDYHYWLINYGSGVIDFVTGSIKIQSTVDLIENEKDGRYYDLQPKDCWKRISLDYAGAPSITALDTTIIDSDGCCPIIETGGYADIVETVYASSWPMYLVLTVIRFAKNAKEKMTFETDSGVNKLTNLSFQDIDVDLEAAHERAMEHNETESDEAEYEEFMNQSREDFVGINLEEMFGNDREIRNLNTSIMEIDNLFSKGITSYLDAKYYIERKTKRKDLDTLYTLLENQNRDLRESAFQAIKRLESKGTDKNIRRKQAYRKLEKVLESTRDQSLISDIRNW